MDRLIYQGMSGARQALEQQAVIAQNLAQAGTTGFRAQIASFRAVPIVGQEITTRTQVVASSGASDLRAGPVATTGRALDVAIRGEGWLAVRLPDGREGYTRDGRLEHGSDGQLRLASGPVVLGEDGPLAAEPGTVLAVDAEGRVTSARPDGSGATPVGRLRLVQAPLLERGDDGYFRLPPGAPAPTPAAQARLQAGALEGSNVNTVQAMVDLIANARQFEMQMKTLHTAEGNEQQADKLLAMN